MQFGWRKTLVYSLAPLFVLASGLEVGARVLEWWVPPLPVDFGWGFTEDSRVFVPSDEEPDLLITHPGKAINFRPQQFRLSKPKDCLRVFFLGGSSVFNLSGDGIPEFPRCTMDLLHARLKEVVGDGKSVEIINAGGNSYGTHRLVRVASEVLEYQPDLLLVYSGHNEFQEVEQLALARPEHVRLQRILYGSAFCRFLRDRFASVQMARLRSRNEEILSNPNPNTIKTVLSPVSPEEMEERMQAYRNNIALIVSACQARGVSIVLGRVASNYWDPAHPFPECWEEVKTYYAEGRYTEGYALVRKGFAEMLVRHQASEVENGLLREVAEEYGVPLADVWSAVEKAEPHGVPGETLFYPYDGCHLNAEGNRVLVEVFAERVRAWMAQGV